MRSKPKMRHLQLSATRGFLVGYALALSMSTQAAVIYRWVDESGRTHVSDVVPERYRRSAIRIDPSRSEVSPEQRQQAELAAARNRTIVEKSDSRRQNSQAVQSAAAASKPPATKRPARGITDDTDCETWRRLYRESMECFAPFRTARGTTKAEGFEVCNAIPSPELKCGPVSD